MSNGHFCICNRTTQLAHKRNEDSPNLKKKGQSLQGSEVRNNETVWNMHWSEVKKVVCVVIAHKNHIQD